MVFEVADNFEDVVLVVLVVASEPFLPQEHLVPLLSLSPVLSNLIHQLRDMRNMVDQNLDLSLEPNHLVTAHYYYDSLTYSACIQIKLEILSTFLMTEYA